MPAVTQMQPAKRCAQIAAHRSIHARICPPKTAPRAFACVGNTYSVICVIESFALRGSPVAGVGGSASLTGATRARPTEAC
jgi:hypothetical protein